MNFRDDQKQILLRTLHKLPGKSGFKPFVDTMFINTKLFAPGVSLIKGHETTCDWNHDGRYPVSVIYHEGKSCCKILMYVLHTY